MSHQANGVNNDSKTGSAGPSSREIDRRKFVQKILASMPAVGLACAVPALAAGETRKPVDWVCRIGVIFESPSFWIYIYINCHEEAIFFEIGQPGMPCKGDCSKPSPPDCFDYDAFQNREHTQDEFKIFYSPQLSKKGREDFERLRKVFTYNLNYGDISPSDVRKVA